jgi:hypothetical protein
MQVVVSIGRVADELSSASQFIITVGASEAATEGQFQHFGIRSMYTDRQLALIRLQSSGSAHANYTIALSIGGVNAPSNG